MKIRPNREGRGTCTQPTSQFIFLRCDRCEREYVFFFHLSIGRHCRRLTITVADLSHSFFHRIFHRMCVSLRKIFMSHMAIVFYSIFFLFIYLSAVWIHYKFNTMSEYNTRASDQWLVIGVDAVVSFSLQNCSHFHSTTRPIVVHTTHKQFLSAFFFSHKSFVSFYATESWSARHINSQKTVSVPFGSVCTLSKRLDSCCSTSIYVFVLYFHS